MKANFKNPIVGKVEIIRKWGYIDELKSSVKNLATLAFLEDLPFGDVTAQALELHTTQSVGHVICREPLTMVGATWVGEVQAAWQERGKELALNIEILAEDGARLEKGSTLFLVSGPAHCVLGFERTFLNFLTRAIGIANQTYELVEMLQKDGVHTHILDTRKTQPGYRLFDKYAVWCGGGFNHRMNLSDQVLIKENHIAKHQGVRKVLEFVKPRTPKGVKIEIEVQSMEECLEAIEAGCDIIMLDNFTTAQVVEACKVKPEHILFEVSGGITKQNILSYCKAGIDRISIGAITHSVIAPDLTMLVEEELERDRSH